MDWIDIFHDAGIPWTLVGVVFVASSLQAITGIGFGVIAGPSLLVAMGSSSAIQVSIALSFLIAILLCPSTLRKVNWILLKPLLFGVAIGTPWSSRLPWLVDWYAESSRCSNSVRHDLDCRWISRK